MKFLYIAAACNLGLAAQATVILMDQGDLGYSQTGSWIEQTIAGRLNNNWRYQANAAGADTALYDFTGLANGSYVLARSSFAQNNLSTAAAYALTDGGGTFTQNQRLKLNHFDLDGSVTFQRLSDFNGYVPVTISDGTLAVNLSDTDAVGFLIADGIRLEQVRNDALKIYVIGNGETGYSETGGTWTSYNETGDHAGGFRYSSGTVADEITVQFSGLDSGLYRISSAWTAGGNRTTSATMSYASGVSNDSVVMNQRPGAAADDGFENVNWQDLFQDVPVSNGFLTLTLRNNNSGAGQLLVADAFRLELTSTVPEPSTIALLGLGFFCFWRRMRRQ